MTQWSLVLPPSRPDVWQLAAIEEILESVDRQAAVAVLGSTPEFRDLLARLGFRQVFVLDRSKAYHAIANQLRVHANVETVVWGDWRQTLPPLDGRFAAVLSDLTSGNIPYENRAAFYRAVARSLAPNGLFVDRVLNHSEVVFDIQELAAKFERYPINLATVNQFSCEFLFCSDMMFEFGIVDSSKMYDELARRYASPVIRTFLTLVPSITPKNCVWWYGRRNPSLEDHYHGALDLNRVFDEPVTSSYYRHAKLVVARRHQLQISAA